MKITTVSLLVVFACLGRITNAFKSSRQVVKHSLYRPVLSSTRIAVDQLSKSIAEKQQEKFVQYNVDDDDEVDVEQQRQEQSTVNVPVPMKRFFIETHGCQMNLADSDVVRSVLLSAGYEMCDILEDADLILTNTCAIRENAEAKIWQRLKYFASLRKKARLSGAKRKGYPIIGVLGCMAERLKTKLLEAEVDFIAGPDAYRDLPKLLMSATTDQKAANVQLSLEETYSDIQPVRLAEGNVHAFVTITRGCNNHCAFCIVPYTRGVERSRPVDSVIAEVEALKLQGVKEVVLLGQNVNSYWDQTSLSSGVFSSGDNYTVAAGFTQRANTRIPKKKSQPHTDPVITAATATASDTAGSIDGALSSTDNSDHGNGEVLSGGVRFAELLARVAAVDPDNMRIRFQSPHPKDFPDEVLELIAKTPNICNSLHMPAQHGNSAMLDRMKRGYTKEAYTSLVKRARTIIAGDTPLGIGLGLSSDFIVGFSNESEEEHNDNVSLMSEIGFDQAFTYAYSRREQTYAGLFYEDNVPEDVKQRRLQQLVDTFQSSAMARNAKLEVGRLHVVLVEGEGKPLKLQQRGPLPSPGAAATGAKRTDSSGVTGAVATGGAKRTDSSGVTGAAATGAKRTDSSGEVAVASARGAGAAATAGGAKTDSGGVTGAVAAFTWTGRTDTNKRVVFPDSPVLHTLTKAQAKLYAELQVPSPTSTSTSTLSSADAAAVALEQGLLTVAQKVAKDEAAAAAATGTSNLLSTVEKGSYVIVKILSARGHTLRGAPIAIVKSLRDAHDLNLPSM